MNVRNSLIGASIERFEDHRFLRGEGVYVGDLNVKDALHAVVLRSPVAHGRIRRLDAEPARRLPGVCAVLTAAEIGPVVPKIPMRMERMPEYTAFEQPVIAVRKVRYVGEPMALVVAQTQAIAEDALDRIVIEIDELPSVTEISQAREGQSLLFEENKTNCPATLSGVKGDVDAAFASAFYRRKEFFKTHRHSAVPMEPRGLCAVWDEDKAHLTLYGAAKVPFHNRATLAQLLGLSETQVLLIENDVGGGFGVRGEFYPEDFLVPYAAKHLRQPVRWSEDRRENLIATNHSREAESTLEIACDEQGRILALRGKAFVNCGAYLRTTGSTPARNIAQTLPSAYRIENVLSDATLVVSNKTPSGTYRGPGRYEADFFRERLFDMAARDFKMDPVEFRRKNLVRPEDMPWPLPTVGAIPSECDSGNYFTTLDRCLAEFQWDKKKALQGTVIDGRRHGIAVSCYIEGAGSGRESARLKLDADGRVSVFVGASGIGQGVETVFAQIAGDALGLPLEKISGVFHGSTNLTAAGVGSFSSRSVVMCGSAILDAAEKLYAAIRKTVAARVGCEASAVQILEGKAICPDGAHIDFGDLAHEVPAIDGAYASSKRTYSYGAHAVHLCVDPGTGKIDILEYVAVEDVGRIVNPHGLHGQCLGAIVQGLGGTLLEHFVYDSQGQMMAGSLADYLLPTASDFPNIKVIALELSPSPNNPLGAKGAAEGGIIPVAGVVSNALAAALSYRVEPNELPFSPSRVWELVQRADLQRTDLQHAEPSNAALPGADSPRADLRAADAALPSAR